MLEKITVMHTAFATVVLLCAALLVYLLFKMRDLSSLRTALASMGYGIITTDRNGNVTGIDGAAEKLSGWSHKEAKGKNFLHILHLVNYDSRAVVENPVTQVLSGSKIARLAEDTILIARGGLERPIECSAVPISSFAGRFTSVIAVLRDVTEHYTMRQKLLESEERLKAVTDEVQVGLVMINRDRRYVYANNFYKQTVGLSNDIKVLGRKVSEVLPVLYDQIKPNLDRAFAGERLSYEIPGIDKKELGLNRIYSVTYEPQVRQSLVMHVVIMVVDVTHIKRS